ncbi:MAG: hypothetical protein ABJ251_19305 [Paracoccaceae bacterium]
MWAVHILQSEKPDPARKFILSETIPDGAISAKMPSEHSIHKWEIETLANELMTVPKAKPKKKGPIRTLRWDHFGAATDCVNWLCNLENVEYRVQKKRDDLFIEMGRIIHLGSLAVQFENNALIDGAGDDLLIFEVGANIEGSRVSVSNDGQSWEVIGELPEISALLPIRRAATRPRYACIDDDQVVLTVPKLTVTSPYFASHRTSP